MQQIIKTHYGKGKITKGLVESMIRDKNLMELSKIEEVREYAEDYCYDLHKNNRNLLNDARDTVTKLGLGGLWCGINIATMIVAQKIKSHSKFF
jgi:hypothetical protein